MNPPANQQKSNSHSRDYTIYTRLMDAALEAKAQSIMKHFGDVPRNAVIVDVGSGTGQLAEYIARYYRNQNAQIYAVDNSHELLEAADLKRGFVHLIYDDAMDLENIPPHSVDIMYHGTLGHEIFSEKGNVGLEKTLTKAYESLKPEGKEVQQMAAIVNLFELSKKWQLDTNLHNWYRATHEDGKTEMIYIGGTVYAYDEKWAFQRVGLLQWIDLNYIENEEFSGSTVPTAVEAKNFKEKWPKMDTKWAIWWKKYLSKVVQP